MFLFRTFLKCLVLGLCLFYSKNIGSILVKRTTPTLYVIYIYIPTYVQIHRVHIFIATYMLYKCHGCIYDGCICIYTFCLCKCIKYTHYYINTFLYTVYMHTVDLCFLCFDNPHSWWHNQNYSKERKTSPSSHEPANSLWGTLTLTMSFQTTKKTAL